VSIIYKANRSCPQHNIINSVAKRWWGVLPSNGDPTQSEKSIASNANICLLCATRCLFKIY